MSEQSDETIAFGPCCFCGGYITRTEIDPCRLTIETQKEKWQVWFCHAACFKVRLSDDPMLEPVHF
jgi:hypothetical protein